MQAYLACMLALASKCRAANESARRSLANKKTCMLALASKFCAANESARRSLANKKTCMLAQQARRAANESARRSLATKPERVSSQSRLRPVAGREQATLQAFGLRCVSKRRAANESARRSLANKNSMKRRYPCDAHRRSRHVACGGHRCRVRRRRRRRRQTVGRRHRQAFFW